MKNIKSYPFVLIILSVFALLLPAIVLAELNLQPFVDFDGDGLDDNIQDIDNNGIPDTFQKVLKLSSNSNLSTFTGFSSGPTQYKSDNLNLTVSESFKLNKFNVRSIDKCRSDSESGFGVRVGFGGSSGGACAGGVCF